MRFAEDRRSDPQRFQLQSDFSWFHPDWQGLLHPVSQKRQKSPQCLCQYEPVKFSWKKSKTSFGRIDRKTLVTVRSLKQPHYLSLLLIPNLKDGYFEMTHFLRIHSLYRLVGVVEVVTSYFADWLALITYEWKRVMALSLVWVCPILASIVLPHAFPYLFYLFFKLKLIMNIHFLFNK